MKIILCADLHLRDDAPRNRIDDYEAAQWGKIAYLKELSDEHEAVVLCAGDIFNSWKPSPYLLRESMSRLWGIHFLCIPGQHDLPQHSNLLYKKSGLSVLQESACIETVIGRDRISGHFINDDEIFVVGFPFDSDMSPVSMKLQMNDSKNRYVRETMKKTSAFKIAMIHYLTYERNHPPFPGCSNLSANVLISDSLKDFNLIISGDNHKTFYVCLGGRILVNPGSMMRMSIDQKNHEPCVFLFDTVTKELVQCSFPISPSVDVFSEQVEESKKRDDRLEAFVDSLEDGYEVGLSFEKNLKVFLSKNKSIHKRTKEIVLEVINE